MDGPLAAQPGNGHGIQHPIAHGHQAGHADLAEARQQVEQALRIALGATEAAEHVDGIAHGHGAAYELLLQPVMRQAQQVMLADQLLGALVHVVLRRARAAYACAPEAGDLAHDHDQDQAAQKVLFREQRQIALVDAQPGQQQHAGRRQAGHRPVAQGHHHGRQPGPGELGLHPQGVVRVGPHADQKGQHRQQQRLAHHHPGLGARLHEQAQRRASEFRGNAGAARCSGMRCRLGRAGLVWHEESFPGCAYRALARPVPSRLRISFWPTAARASRLQPLCAPAPLHTVAPVPTSTISSVTPTAGSPSTPTL